MSVSEQLAAYVLAHFDKDVPEAVHKIAISALVDQYGLQIAGSKLPFGKSLYEMEKNQNKSIGCSSIAGYGDQVSPVHAAYINSCFAHAKDFDDSHQQAQTHAGSVVIPAAMAIAEARQYPAEKVFKAIIWGIEIMLRISHTISPACMEGGHHTCPTTGPFGAAIACGLLMDLSPTELTHALGICGSFSGGLTEFSLSGGSVKRTYTGLGARHGLEAVLMAKSGITAPASIFEGKKGLWSVFGRGFAQPDRLFDGIGDHYLISSTVFKAYSCCLLIHPALDAFKELCRRHHLAASDIDSVRVGLSQFSASHVGSITIPKDELGAQFSTSFMLALSLIEESPTMWTDIERALSNTEIIALAKRIQVYKDKETSLEFPEKNGAIVQIYTKSGEYFSLSVSNPAPLTAEDLKHKFIQNSEPVLGLTSAEDFYHKLVHFEQLSSVKVLFSMS